MSPTGVSQERKRARVGRAATASDDEERPPSDDDRLCVAPPETPARPGQAERKRELERNRRNLVNVRFAELEAELRRAAPRPDAPAPPAKGRRIDKEAVLKDAAQRLVAQRKELSAAADRMAAMVSEISNLRAEKVELRGDKAYLRSELQTVRGDVQRLRSDNINLWQALRKASAIKNSFAPDVAKLPAELFLRPKAAEPATASTPMPTAMPTTSLAPTTVPSAALAPTQLQSAEQQQQHQQQSVQQQEHSVQQLLLMQQQQDEHRRQFQNAISASAQQPQTTRSPSLAESLLVLQTPEELGELFANYVPRELTSEELASEQAPPPQPAAETPASSTAMLQPDAVANPLFHSVNTPGGTMHTAGMPSSIFGADGQQLNKAFDLLPSDPNAVRHVPESTQDTPARTEKKEGPMSDIAYCV